MAVLVKYTLCEFCENFIEEHPTFYDLQEFSHSAVRLRLAFQDGFVDRLKQAFRGICLNEISIHLMCEVLAQRSTFLRECKERGFTFIELRRLLDIRKHREP